MNNYSNKKRITSSAKKNTLHRLSNGTSAFFVLDSVFFCSVHENFLIFIRHKTKVVNFCMSLFERRV